MDLAGKLITQLKDFWKQASSTGRVVTVLATLLILATAIGSAVWSSRPDFKLLREGISPVLTAEIVSVLDAAGIANKMNHSGTGVSVSTSRWNEANIAIAKLGIPEESVGKPPGGFLSPGVSHEDSLRNKELGLERSLTRLRSIKSASVHLAMPEPSPFKHKRQPTTASVILEAQPGYPLSQELGASIVAMVSSAVEGLDPANVTVADADGSLIGGKRYGDETGIADRFQYIRDVEASLVMKAQDVLAAKLGPNKSVVRVTAQVDMKNKVVTVNKIESDAKVRLTETIVSSDTKGLPLMTAGPAGTSSNGLGAAGDTTSQPVSGKHETNTTSYDYPRTVEEIHEVAGQLLRLSVSAMVDITPPDTSGAAPNVGTQDLSQEQVEELIKTAVGFDDARGDRIEVVLTSFPELAVDADLLAVPDTKQWEFVTQLARNASLGLAAVAALLIGMLTLKKMQPIEIASNDADRRRRELLSELSARVDQNPEAVSRILSAWLGQQRQADGKADVEKHEMKHAA